MPDEQENNGRPETEAETIVRLQQEVAFLRPYKDELIKIAALVGEEADPFAAWEHIQPMFETHPSATPLAFGYVNHRGEFAYRHVIPVNVWHGSIKQRPGATVWYLRAKDRGGEWRDFDIGKINIGIPVTVTATIDAATLKGLSDEMRPLTDENMRLRTELGRAYRALRGFYGCIVKHEEPSDGMKGYHSLTLGAAARHVNEGGTLEGAEYFIGKDVSVLQSALAYYKPAD